VQNIFEGIKGACQMELLQDHQMSIHNDYEPPKDVFNNIDKIISNCDINQDGKIDYQEFIQSTISQQSVINRVKI